MRDRQLKIGNPFDSKNHVAHYKKHVQWKCIYQLSKM